MGKPLVRSLRYVTYRTGGRVSLLHLCGNQTRCVCIALPHTAHSLCSHCRELVGTPSSSFIGLVMLPGVPPAWSQVQESKSRVVSQTLYTALLPFIKDISVFVSYYITALFVSFNHGHLPWASLWSVRLGMSHIERVEECFCCTFVGISLVVYALHFRIQHTRCVATAENTLAHLPLLFIKL